MWITQKIKNFSQKKKNEKTLVRQGEQGRSKAKAFFRGCKAKTTGNP
jgi:hypothetical protein